MKGYVYQQKGLQLKKMMMTTKKTMTRMMMIKGRVVKIIMTMNPEKMKMRAEEIAKEVGMTEDKKIESKLDMIGKVILGLKKAFLGNHALSVHPMKYSVNVGTDVWNRLKILSTILFVISSGVTSAAFVPRDYIEVGEVIVFQHRLYDS